MLPSGAPDYRRDVGASGMKTRWWAPACFALAMGGCYTGTQADGGAADEGTGEGGDSVDGSGESGEGESGEDVDPAGCNEMPPPRASLLRMSKTNYVNALQDVFVVALRRLDDFRDGTHPRAWLFAIALRVAGNFRRAQSRRAPLAPLMPDALPAPLAGPFDLLSRSEAARTLHELLARLDDDKRAVFVLAELEQMTAPEIAQALAVNVNTVYSRLRVARIAFEQALQLLRSRAEDEHG